MSMLNYGELKTEVATWMVRADAQTLARIPDFIRLAETEMYRGLESQDNEFQVIWTQDDNPKNPIVLPENFESFKMLTYGDQPLERLSDVAVSTINQSNATLPPFAFTTEERQLIIAPWLTDDIDPASDEFEIKLDYYGTESITQMSYWNTATNPNIPPTDDGTPSDTVERGDAATTRLFLRNPDLFLSGALYWGFLFGKFDKDAMKWKAIFDNSLKKLQLTAKRRRRSGSTTRVASAYDKAGRYSRTNP